MARRRQARRSDQRTPAWLWFAGGLVCGLGLATMAWIGGYLPQPQQMPVDDPSGRDEPPIAELEEPAPQRQYDFFSVLPELEVVVPTREIEERAREQTAEPEGAGKYWLQVGSFRNAGDADGLKAQLALLGMVAHVQEVTVDGNTWYRVRIGPFEGARATDSARRQLLDAGFEAMVLSGG